MASEATTEHEAGSEEKDQQPHIDERVCCDYYISARGCVKGDSCDFLHPLAPSGASTNRVCDFDSTARGCVKGDKCEFLHPRRLNPRGEPTTRVCSFFLTPQGCLKGSLCDHLHPRVIPAQHLPPGPPIRGGLRGGFSGGGRMGGGGVTVCQFYLTPQGCNRGNLCPFLHPTGRAAQQALAAKEAGARIPAGRPVPSCDYFFSRRGCSKGDSCPFSHVREPQPHAPHAPFNAGWGAVHQGGPMYGGGGPSVVVKRPKVCSFHSTERGCVKGNACEYIHVKDKLCTFVLSEKGCKKGATCDHKHPKEGE